MGGPRGILGALRGNKDRERKEEPASGEAR
jgi:hypothetical protein